MAQRVERATITEILERIPIFENLPKEDLRLLSGLVTTVERPEGSRIAEQGRLGREAMIILSGEASVRRDGEEIARLGPGDIFGEMSLINRAPRTADVVALSRIDLLVMDSREFTSLLSGHPTVAVKILQTVVARILQNHGDGI